MTAQKILTLAAAELGTTESPAGSNKQKYGKAYGWDGVAWCVMFVWYVFRQSGMSGLFCGGGKTASCGELMNYAKANGLWVTGSYRPGDLVIMDFPGNSTVTDHVGIVESVSGNVLNTIEGNTSPDSSGSQYNGGTVCRKKRDTAKVKVLGAYRPRYREVEQVKYYNTNNTHIIACPISAFAVRMVDTQKKNVGRKNYCNAGYFGSFSENGTAFTLPVGNLVCDVGTDNAYVKKYSAQRGVLSGGRYRQETASNRGDVQFLKKSVSTLIVENGKACVAEVTSVPSGAEYAISGVPIMRDGGDVIFKSFVKQQGWTGDELRATSHIFLGLKDGDPETVYILGWKSITSNMVSTAEAFKHFKELGFRDVIKLDGGGSYVLNIDGKVYGTSENRRINTIITFGAVTPAPETEEDEMGIQLDTLKRGSKGAQTKALQAILKGYGYNIGSAGVDGDFGSGTEKAVLAYQSAHALSADGIVGEKTWTRLLKG